MVSRLTVAALLHCLFGFWMFSKYYFKHETGGTFDFIVPQSTEVHCNVTATQSVACTGDADCVQETGDFVCQTGYCVERLANTGFWQMLGTVEFKPETMSEPLGITLCLSNSR